MPVRWILLIILAMQAATCGQKGPLTLPQDTVATVVPAPTATAPIADITS